MPIRLADFSGIVPRLDAERLPDNAAQVALNCDVTSGALRPLSVGGPFVRLHDDTGHLVSGIPAGDVVQIAKPATPSVNLQEHLAKPEVWLRVFAYDWVSYIDPNSGNRLVFAVRQHYLPLLGKVFTETEVYLLYFLFPQTYLFYNGGPYFLRGPRYQFAFGASPGANGGPDQTITFPSTPSEGDPEFPEVRVPLVDPNSQIYGYFQVVDVMGPRYDEDILVTDYEAVLWSVPGAFVIFRCDMNYANPRREHRYYVTTALDAFDREGPPSEISGKVVLKPGQRLRMNVPKPSGAQQVRIYRAGTTNTDDFRKVDDTGSGVYTDWKESLGDPIPPWGNFPGTDKTGFLRGSSMHPAHFGVAFRGKTLYLSDFERPHAWPKEFTVPFQAGIKAAPVTGDTVVVFSGDLVYAVAGNNPEFMRKYLLSESHPLLNVAGLCRIGNTLYWPTHDGLAACSGSSVQVVSSEHFTREQWRALNPETMRARAADNSIFLEYETGNRPGLRFDLEEKLSAVTTFTTLSATSFRWVSRVFWHEQPTIYDYARVTADGPATLRVYADGVLVRTVQAVNGDPIALGAENRTNTTGRIGGPVAGAPPGSNAPIQHARQWHFEVESGATVRRIEAFEREIVTVGDEVRIGADQVPVWRSMWFSFTDADRWAVGRVLAQTTLPVTVRFFADGALVHTETVRSGRVFRLPRTLPRAALWRVDVDSPVRVDELYLRRRVTADAGDGIRELFDGPYAPWLAKRYEFTDQRRLNSVIVHAAKPVTMRLYYDGSVDPSQTVAVSGGAEQRIPLGRYSSVEFDFGGDDADVREAILFVSRVEPMGLDGASMVNPASRRGRLFKFPDRGKVCAGVVGASAYPLTVRVYADGALADTVTVANGNVFSLKRSVPDASLWEFDIEGDAEVNSALFLARRPEAVQGRTIMVSNPRTVPYWLYTQYQFVGPTRLVSAWVEAGEAVTMRLYLDGAVTPSRTVTLQPRVETLLNLPADCERVEFDFAGKDDRVINVGLFGLDAQRATLGGIVEGLRPNYRRLQYQFEDGVDMACASVAARDYTGVRLAVAAGGTQVLNRTVSDGKVLKLPRQRRDAPRWEVDVTAPKTGVVEGFALLPWRSVQAGAAIRATNPGGIPPWLHTRYELGGRMRIRSVIVDADHYPVTMRLYYDRSAGVSKALTVSSPRETLVEDERMTGCVEFDFTDDSVVREVTVFPAEVRPVAGPIDMPNPESWRGLRFQFADRGTWACASIGANRYPVTLRLWRDGILEFEGQVKDGHLFQFPRTMREGKEWRFDIDAGDLEVTSILLVPWRRVAVDTDVLRVMGQETGIPDWLWTKWEFTDKGLPGAAIIHAETYNGLKAEVYADGVLQELIDVVDAREFRWPAMGTVNEMTFSFPLRDHLINEVLIFQKTVQPVSTGSPIVVAGLSLRGNRYQFPKPTRLACGHLVCTDERKNQFGFRGVAMVRLYADGSGTPALTQRVVTGEAFRLPLDLPAATRWEVDIETDEKVSAFTLLPWQRVQAGGGAISLAPTSGEIPRWFYTEWEFPAPVRWRSARVKSVREVPMDLYADTAGQARSRYMVGNGIDEQRLEPVTEGATLRFDFAGEDGAVHEVSLFAEEVVAVDGGVIVRPAAGRVAWRNKVFEFKDTGSWNVGRVTASRYPVTLELYAHGQLQERVEVTGSGEFRFDGDLPNAKEWEIDVQTSGDVREVVLIPRDSYHMTDRYGKPMNRIDIEREAGPFTWLGKRVIAQRPTAFGAARVTADRYPVKLRFGSDRTVEVEALALDSKAFRLPRMLPAREWVVDVEADESVQIHDVRIGVGMEDVRK